MCRDHPELPHIIVALKDAFSCAVKSSSLLNSAISSSRVTTLYPVCLFFYIKLIFNIHVDEDIPGRERSFKFEVSWFLLHVYEYGKAYYYTRSALLCS